jgi:hypothetical protein
VVERSKIVVYPEKNIIWYLHDIYDHICTIKYTIPRRFIRGIMCYPEKQILHCNSKTNKWDCVPLTQSSVRNGGSSGAIKIVSTDGLSDLRSMLDFTM